MTNTLPVTPAQADFITSLLRSRIVPAELADKARKVADKATASRLIDSLKVLPWAPRVAVAVATVSPERGAYLAALEAVEVGKYAVPTRYLHGLLPANYLKNDLLFFEVKRWKGRKFFNRLSGAPGAFNRFRLESAYATGMLKFIAGRHVEFGKLFSEHYGVCGRCAAELTDQTSRETGFGPECRRIFKIA